jgi:hypothetical protein
MMPHLVPSKCRVMSPAKSPAIVVFLLAMMTGATLTEPAGARPQITQIIAEKEFARPIDLKICVIREICG